MREKELRLALVCYGGVSLAVYMHGITKEIWRLACASRAFHAGEAAGNSSQAVYHGLLETIRAETGLQLRVLADILSGSSAGGINAVFLAQAISTGQSLDPLTDLWLEHADIDALTDRDDGGIRRFVKNAAVPLAWTLANRSDTVDQTVDPEHRAEVRAKLARIVKAPWFAPPFGGAAFVNLLLDAFDAMAAAPAGPPLLPDYQPLDLFVTVTDFRGYPQHLRLNSPPEVLETEHRLILSYRDRGGAHRRLADPAELAFAARATASFPGAFPPFRIEELDEVLAQRARPWPSRSAFLERSLPRRAGEERPEDIVLIDGSVLANAPFRPCIEALRSRLARREIDRRFVYIDPMPGLRTVRLNATGEAAPPGFVATLFGAMSDIPREQPIHDNLEWIERRSERIRRMRRIVDSMRPAVEAAIERAFGNAFFLASASASRLRSWRVEANALAARDAGYAFAPYAQLKISVILEEMARVMAALGGIDRDPGAARAIRESLWHWARGAGLTNPELVAGGAASPEVLGFFRSFDISFRIRRLRLLARALADTAARPGDEEAEAANRAREAVYAMIARYEARLLERGQEDPDIALFAAAAADPAAAAAALEARLDLRALDDETDIAVAEALAGLSRGPRHAFILTYLGYPFYDIATLPLLQGEELQEFDPMKVDRISPDDATAIRAGTAATLKGTQFNTFGAFFCRAYRENDYLWGRLHGADRLIDIIVSTLPRELPASIVTRVKREAFRAVLQEERGRLTSIPALFEQLEAEIG
jgi:patatin-related protein